MIPLIQREAAQKHGWISDEDILEIVSIAESTPGPIAINAATFVGYRVCGIGGAFFATVGVVIPSFLIILAISYVLRQFESFLPVQYAFQGIRAGVLAMIAKALVLMYAQCPRSVLSYIIMAFAFVCVAFLEIPVLAVILCCAALGILGAWAADRKVWLHK